ncbi:trypsin-like serine peptidase [Deinococcus oregonensis]|uniref:Serine protease n=1 Tax=Deinococcus oregonensis TaxID=1805970 RepID=A0ABV6AY30_9DEIO
MTQSPRVSIVFPPDTRVRIQATETYPYSATGQLQLKFKANPQTTYIGTGTLIGDTYVLTAAHNLWDSALGGYATSVVFTPGRNADAAPFGTAPASALYVPEDYITAAPPSLLTDPNGGVVKDVTPFLSDFALIQLAKAAPLAAGRCRVQAYTDQTILNSPVILSGYPVDRQPAGSQWMWQSQPGQVRPSGDSGEHFLFYTLSTYGGQSGAGLLIPDNTSRGICGVHVAGDAQLKTNFAVRINAENLDTIQAWQHSGKMGHAMEDA